VCCCSFSKGREEVVNLKVTADKKYLKKVADKADFALMHNIGGGNSNGGSEDAKEDSWRRPTTSPI